ncbi:MAG TPA: ClbS/DfsB family four-helix bundle protein [Chloroflexia bacterium]|nr:ClbS/DfsB family four-helix bundle protein [Chloroflexia bacterium]
MGRKMDKARTLAALETRFNEFLAVLAQVPPERREAPTLDGEWSVKDLLAHITFWEGHTLTGIQAGLRGERPDWPTGSTDTINARIAAQSHDRPLAQVLADFHQTHRAFMDQIAALDEADLIEPGRFDWSRRRPVRAWVYEDGYGHYPRHTRQLQAWLDRPAGG